VGGLPVLLRAKRWRAHRLRAQRRGRGKGASPRRGRADPARLRKEGERRAGPVRRAPRTRDLSVHCTPPAGGIQHSSAVAEGAGAIVTTKAPWEAAAARRSSRTRERFVHGAHLHPSALQRLPSVDPPFHFCPPRSRCARDSPGVVAEAPGQSCCGTNAQATRNRITLE